MTPAAAVALAREREADLVEIVPNANPPVCKIINLGKYKYELAKKDKIQKKHQHVSLLKELRFHPRTDVHDFEFKTRHARSPTRRRGRRCWRAWWSASPTSAKWTRRRTWKGGA
jgi:translation initiation factor IF-3